MPAKSGDHPAVTKNASPALDALASNLQRLLDERPSVTKTELGKAAKCDPKTITRILAKTNEPSLETVSGLAKFFDKQPWQLVHPDLWEAHAAPPTIGQALDVLVHELAALPGESQKGVADLLFRLSLAPDSAITRDALSKAFAIPDGAGHTPLGAPIAPEKIEDLEELSRLAEENHGKRIRKRQVNQK